jgi:Fic family protein
MELLPPKNADLETTKILKKLIEANKNLAELKGVSKTIPNQRILINTLAIQEAMDSSEIENIITTRDQVYIAKDDQDNNMVKQIFEDFENLENRKKSNLNKTCSCRPIKNG